jgi:hypothetical protein
LPSRATIGRREVPFIFAGDNRDPVPSLRRNGHHKMFFRPPPRAMFYFHILPP